MNMHSGYHQSSIARCVDSKLSLISILANDRIETIRGNDVIEIIECKRWTIDIYMNSIHLECVIISSPHEDIISGVVRLSVFAYVDVLVLSFINLPFRLSLLAALHTLKSCMRLIIISVFEFDWPLPFNGFHFSILHLPFLPK